MRLMSLGILLRDSIGPLERRLFVQFPSAVNAFDQYKRVDNLFGMILQGICDLIEKLEITFSVKRNDFRKSLPCTFWIAGILSIERNVLFLQGHFLVYLSFVQVLLIKYLFFHL